LLWVNQHLWQITHPMKCICIMPAGRTKVPLPLLLLLLLLSATSSEQ
jgi:hypothetical protein